MSGRIVSAVASFVVLLLSTQRCTAFADDAPADDTTTAANMAQLTLGRYELEKARWEQEARVREALRQPISVSFDETPLREALEQVSQQIGVLPDSWAGKGGDAVIRGGGNTLIIRHTGAGHRAGAKLLERIERVHNYVRDNLSATPDETE